MITLAGRKRVRLWSNIGEPLQLNIRNSTRGIVVTKLVKVLNYKDNF